MSKGKAEDEHQPHSCLGTICSAARPSDFNMYVNRLFVKMGTPLVTVTILILGSLIFIQYMYLSSMLQEVQSITQTAEEKAADLDSCTQEKRALLSSMNLEALQKEKDSRKYQRIEKGFKGQRMVHIDLKGAPPSMDYLLELLPLLKKLGATGILIEYEDMFPYKGSLRTLSRKNAYSYKNIKTLLSTAEKHKLQVIPLIQTFGHFEFVLKHREFTHLRETEKYPNAPCPMKEESRTVVYKMIDQVLDLHRGITRIHVGGDEIFNLKDCSACKKSSKTKAELYLHHMVPILKYVMRKGGGNIIPIIWDDMLRSWSIPEMKELSSLAEIMIWGYVPTLEGYPLFTEDMWDKYGKSFTKVWIASSYKGAIRPDANLPPLSIHIENHLSWLKIIKRLQSKTKVVGIALTGWARYDHFATLCETLPAGLPSLGICLRVLIEGQYSMSINRYVSSILGFQSPIQIAKDPFGSYDISVGKFPGAEVYSLTAELENFVSWYETTKNRIDSWANKRQQAMKIISPLHVESSLTAMKQLVPSFQNFKKKCREVLAKYFDEGTVSEWIADKVDTRIQLVHSLNKTVTNLITNLSLDD